MSDKKKPSRIVPFQEWAEKGGGSVIREADASKEERGKGEGDGGPGSFVESLKEKASSEGVLFIQMEDASGNSYAFYAHSENLTEEGVEAEEQESGNKVFLKASEIESRGKVSAATESSSSGTGSSEYMESADSEGGSNGEEGVHFMSELFAESPGIMEEFVNQLKVTLDQEVGTDDIDLSAETLGGIKITDPTDRKGWIVVGGTDDLAPLRTESVGLSEVEPDNLKKAVESVLSNMVAMGNIPSKDDLEK